MTTLRLALVAAALLASGCGGDRADRRACASAGSATAAPPRTPRKFAVILNGDSEQRHKENAQRAYSTLLALGFSPERTFLLTPRDRRVALPAGALRLAPRPAEFTRVMDQLETAVEPGDLVVIYGTGHGDTSTEGESLLELHRGELWAFDLRDQVERLRGDTVVVMDQCFSGGFVDAFDGARCRAIVISTVDSEHETDCYYFSRAFWRSFTDPKRSADRNNDGRITVREAFSAALAAHRAGLAGDPDLRADGIYRSFNGLNDATLN